MSRPVFTPRDRWLAVVGLAANLLGLIAASVVIGLPDPWHTANLVLAISAWIPTAVVGIIACIALIGRRGWGMVLALVALGLQLLALVPYGIVRLSLLASERSQGLVAVISLVVADVLLKHSHGGLHTTVSMWGYFLAVVAICCWMSLSHMSPVMSWCCQLRS